MESDLFTGRRQAQLKNVEPLAVRMRPTTLDEFAGQLHVLGPGKLLRRMIDAGSVSSLILHGPPGTGKTTLAEVVALATDRIFVRENAAAVGVVRIREVIEQAKARLQDGGRRTVLFLDEIHRFTRSQQDVLLGDVERGTITLIGATTENPLFAVNSALASRSTLVRLEPLSEADIVALLRRAIADPVRGYGAMPLTVTDDALSLLATLCDGDARKALGALEVAVLSTMPEANKVEAGPGAVLAGRPHVTIDAATAEESIQRKAVSYDASGDEHYDSASAMIKSVRGSDPDAAMYWAARMLAAGEDPRFLCRRLAILASEDIGNADPRAIMVAQAAWDLVERIGMPEARITIGQLVAYLALCAKSNASYLAIDAAMRDVQTGRTQLVPFAIKDKVVKAAAGKSAGTGTGAAYQYSHDVVTTGAAGQVGGITNQSYLGVNERYYKPVQRGFEVDLAARLEAVLAERKASTEKGMNER